MSTNNIFTITETLDGHTMFSGSRALKKDATYETSQVADRFSHHIRQSSNVGILPPVVRWISPSRRCVILERPPTLVSIVYHGMKVSDLKKATEQTFDIALPWMCYGVVFDHLNRPLSVRLYALHGPLESPLSRLFDLPLPNIYEDSGLFCLPSTESFGQRTLTLSQGLAAAYQMVWSSGFNTDIIHNVKIAYEYKSPAKFFEIIPEKYHYKVKPADIFRAWSQIDIGDIGDVEWHPAQIGTVSDLISVIGADDNHAQTLPYLINTLATTLQ